MENYPGWLSDPLPVEGEGVDGSGNPTHFTLQPEDGRPKMVIDQITHQRLMSGELTPTQVYRGEMAKRDANVGGGSGLSGGSGGGGGSGVGDGGGAAPAPKFNWGKALGGGGGGGGGGDYVAADTPGAGNASGSSRAPGSANDFDPNGAPTEITQFNAGGDDSNGGTVKPLDTTVTNRGRTIQIKDKLGGMDAPGKCGSTSETFEIVTQGGMWAKALQFKATCRVCTQTGAKLPVARIVIYDAFGKELLATSGNDVCGKSGVVELPPRATHVKTFGEGCNGHAMDQIISDGWVELKILDKMTSASSSFSGGGESCYFVGGGASGADVFKKGI